MKNGSIISIEKMTKHFSMGSGRFTALKNIDLIFKKGEFTGIIGPSGSGKSTLLNIIGSLDTPSEGKALVLDQDIGTLNAKKAAWLRKTKLGFIFQTYNLLPVHTVLKMLNFHCYFLIMIQVHAEKWSWNL